MTKYCTTCRTEKPKDQFAKRKRSKDGLQAACKACNAQYRQDHMPELVAYQKAYKKRNR